MLEFLKNAYETLKADLTSNGEHRASLAEFVTTTHNMIVDFETRLAALEQAAAPAAALLGAGDKVAALEKRVTDVESTIAAGFSAAQPLANVADALAAAAQGAPAAVHDTPQAQ